MNVNTHNNIAMMSSMVGVPQQNTQTKQVNKDLDSTKQVLDMDKGEESNEMDKEAPQLKNQQGGHQSESVARQQTKSVQRRFVAEDYKQEQKAKGPESEMSQDLQHLESKQQGRVMLDTSSQIQHKFQKVLTQQQQPNTQNRMKPDVQRKQFADNLRKWVDVEYKQFVKQNDPLYTRRNLREILSALGDQDPSSKKVKSDRDNSKTTVQFSKFNKYNITQASKAMRIFEEIPSNLDTIDYDLVA